MQRHTNKIATFLSKAKSVLPEEKQSNFQLYTVEGWKFVDCFAWHFTNSIVHDHSQLNCMRTLLLSLNLESTLSCSRLRSNTFNTTLQQNSSSSTICHVVFSSRISPDTWWVLPTDTGTQQMLTRETDGHFVVSKQKIPLHQPQNIVTIRIHHRVSHLTCSKLTWYTTCIKNWESVEGTPCHPKNHTRIPFRFWKQIEHAVAKICWDSQRTRTYATRVSRGNSQIQ